MRLAQSRTADGPAVPVAAYGGRWFGLSPVLGLRLRVNGELRTCGQETSSRSRSIASAVSGRPVAHAALYLASPRAGSTTGAEIAVDGGMAGLRLRPRT